jgi:hypothetical protein
MVQRMMDPEVHDFCMLIDAHSTFVAAWDMEVTRNWVMTRNPRAVVTTYPKDKVVMEKSLLKWPNERVFDPRYFNLVNLTTEGWDFPVRYGVDPNVMFAPKNIPVICSLKYTEPALSSMVKYNAATCATRGAVHGAATRCVTRARARRHAKPGSSVAHGRLRRRVLVHSGRSRV